MSTNAAAIGHLAKNWPALNEIEPAIIVNPSASPLDVLAWCWGEVESLCHAVDAMGEAGRSVDGDAISSVLFHRIAPLSQVMSNAIQRLVEAQRSACDRCPASDKPCLTKGRA